MKNLLFTIAFTAFSATGLKAQHTYAKQVKFIEGIEIKHTSQPGSTQVPSTQPISPVNNQDNPPEIENSCSIQFKFALLLNRNVEAITNFRLFSFIDDWWETRYRYGGTNKAGIDCSAFSGTLYNYVFAIDLPRTAREQYSVCDRLNRAQLAEGDLVFFNTRGGVSHVGVYLGDGYFVHASTNNGVTINNLDDDYYSARFINGGRINRQLLDETAGMGTR